MSSIRIDQIRPMPGWALCRMKPPTTQTSSGLHIGRDVEDGKVSEGVCQVLAVSWEVLDNGEEVDPGFVVGDYLLIREFLKNANSVGDLVGEKRNRVFLMNNKDAMAVLPPGTGLRIGHYGEYEL